MSNIIEKAKVFAAKNRIALIAGAFLITALLPFVFTSSYSQGILTKIIIYAIIGTGLNTINGYSGQTNLGMAGFMCVGAYMAAILSTYFQVPSILCLIAGGIFSGFVGYLVSLPTLRLSGTFLTIITLGFSETIRLIVINWTSVTHGTLGIKGLPSLSLFGMKIKSGAPYFWFTLVVLALVLFFLSRILSSRVGRAWISIREDQDAARSLGVEIAKYKSINFIAGAMIGGLGGALMLFYYRYVAPDMFLLDEGFNVLSMVTIGGTGTLIGPLLGSVLINLITEVLRFAAEFRLVLYAILIIGTMWLRPQGLAGASDSNVANAAGIKLFARKEKAIHATDS